MITRPLRYPRLPGESMQRTPGWIGLILFPVFLFAAMIAGAADEPAKAAPTLDEELSQAAAEVQKALSEPRQRLVQRQIEGVIQALSEEHKLDAAAVAVLQEAAKKAVAETAAPWGEAYIKATKASYQRSGTTLFGVDPRSLVQNLKARAVAYSNLGEQQVESVVNNSPAPSAADPQTRPVWRQALEKVLSREQFAAEMEKAAEKARAAEKQFADAVEKMARTSEGQLKLEIESLVERVRNAIPLDEARAKALDAAAAAAVGQALEKRKKEYAEALELLPPARRATSVIGNRAFLGDVVLHPNPGEQALPSTQKAWTEGLEKILTPEEMAHWTKSVQAFEAAETRKIEEELKLLLEQSAAAIRQRLTTKIEPAVAEIRAAVKLDDTRSKALDAAAAAAVAGAFSEWQGKAKDSILRLPANQRDTILRGGNASLIQRDSGEMPQNQVRWLDGVNKLLTPEEKKLWQDDLARREQRQKRTATLVLMGALTERIGLTDEQRGRIEPLLAPLAAAQVPVASPARSLNLDVNSLINAARQANHAEIKKHLEDWQRSAWEFTVEKTASKRPGISTGDAGQADGGQPADSPQRIESEISAFLHEMLQFERKAIQQRLTPTLRVLVRATNLTGARLKRLEVAAKGVAEEEADAWLEQYSQWVRAQVTGQQPRRQPLAQQLRSMGRPGFALPRAENSPLFKSSIATLLEGPERASWEREISTRMAYQNRVAIESVLTQLDHGIFLSEDQLTRLAGMLATAFEQYGPDADQSFANVANSDPNAPAWRLNPSMNLSMLMGIPEADLKKLLSPSQWKMWETQFRPRVQGVWNNVQQARQKRVPPPKTAP